MRKIVCLSLLAIAVVLFTAPVLAQPEEMTPEQMAEMEAYMSAGRPGAAHAELAATVGKYDVEVKNFADPTQPPMISTGIATRTMTLDGRIRQEDFVSDFMGMSFTGIGRVGYDNVSGNYWSTWTDSMSTGVMVSSGSCDDKNNCTFSGTWNDPVSGGPVTSRLTTQWTDANTEVFSMHGPGKDGKEMKMMELVYTKQP